MTVDRTEELYAVGVTTAKLMTTTSVGQTDSHTNATD